MTRMKPGMNDGAATRTSRLIKAAPETIFQALTDPAALAVWRAPSDMTGEVHRFVYGVGGGYEMSLYYPASEASMHGKTQDSEDRFTARYVEITPPERIVEAIIFHSQDTAFQGEMFMEVTLKPEDNGTNVTILFRNLPPGIRPEDNETGTISALEKLARYVEQDAPPAASA